MKYIKLLIIFFLLIATHSCEEGYEPINEYSDFDFMTTIFGANKTIAVGDYMSFSDLSMGAISHTWSFDINSGMKFLKKVEIPKKVDYYYPYIDPKLGSSSVDKTVHVIYTKGGTQSIRLYNTYKDYVVFEGVRDTLAAIQVGNEWVIDTTFTVEVLDSIQVALKVFDGDKEILDVPFDQHVDIKDSATWPVYELMTGKSLKFVDMTEVGQPTSRTWTFKNGQPETSEDSVAVVSYFKLGTYYANIFSERTGEDEDYPSDSKRQYVPLHIKVIPSDQDLVATSVVELIDETIQISASGILKDFKGKEGSFTVSVSNNNGFDNYIAVETASINNEDASKIDLTLSEKIYNTDVITVTYSGKNIKSIDGRNLEPFVDMPVELYNPNMLTAYDFEDVSQIWKVTKGTMVASYVTDIVSEGNASLRLDNTGNKSEVYPTDNPSPFAMSIGTSYHLEYKVYFIDALITQWQVRLAEDGSESSNYYGATDVPTDDMEANKWITITNDFESTKEADVMKLGIRLFSTGSAYFDGFVLKEVEERPL